MEEEKKRNYFEVLNLKPDASDEEIKETIEKKREEWTDAQTSPDPQKQSKAVEDLQNIDEMKTILLSQDSEELREQKVEAQEKIRKGKEDLFIMLGTYGQLQDSDIAALLKRYGTCGIDEDDVRRLYEDVQNIVGVKDVTLREFNSEDYLDQDTVRDVERFIRALNSPNIVTLYDFLSEDSSISADALKRTASSDQLKQRAEDISSAIQSNGQKLTTDAARQNLCTICIKMFEDETGKMQYDNYLYLKNSSRDAASAHIDRIVGKNPDHCFTENAAVKFIKVMLSTDVFSTAEECLDYIVAYCNYKGYKIGKINWSLLISIFDGVDSEATTTANRSAALEKLKHALAKGLERATKISKKETSADLCRSDYESYCSQAEAYKKNAKDVKVSLSPNSKVCRNVLIVRCIPIVIIALIMAGISSYNNNPYAMHGVLMFIQAIFLIALIVVAIRGIISLGRFCFWLSKDTTKADLERNEFLKKQAGSLSDAQEKEDELKTLEEEIVSLKQDEEEILILSSPYKYKPICYEDGLEYVKSDKASTVEAIYDLLCERYSEGI